MEVAAEEGLQPEVSAISAKQISLARGTSLRTTSRVLWIEPPQLSLCSLVTKRSAFQPFNLSS